MSSFYPAAVKSSLCLMLSADWLWCVSVWIFFCLSCVGFFWATQVHGLIVSSNLGNFFHYFFIYSFAPLSLFLLGFLLCKCSYPWSYSIGLQGSVLLFHSFFFVFLSWIISVYLPSGLLIFFFLLPVQTSCWIADLNYSFIIALYKSRLFSWFL